MVGRPEFIRVVQFRPKGRNSLTTFRGQTALRGCPRARGVRCRIAPYRSLCSPPTLPAGRFGLRPRPHWGHASLRDSSLRSPAGKKPFIAHFAGGARNVAHSILDSFYLLSCALMLALILFQKGQGFFPSLPIAALLPRRWRLANSKECHLGCYSVAWVFSRRKKTLSIWCKICPISTSWDASACLEYFSNKKASAGSNPRWPFSEP